MILRSSAATDVGRVRQLNEDAFHVDAERGLFIVADGMGGYQRGDVAAELACNVIKETITAHRHVIDLYRRAPSDASKSAVRTMLDTAMQKACKEVHEAAIAMTGKGGRMGTTMDILHPHPSHLCKGKGPLQLGVGHGDLPPQHPKQSNHLGMNYPHLFRCLGFVFCDFYDSTS